VTKEIDFNAMASELRQHMLAGETPSAAGKALAKQYGVTSWVDMAHCFHEAFHVADSDFTAALAQWQPVESSTAISDEMFDARMTPLIESARSIWSREANAHG
jgi:hypothetical protein